MQITLGSRLELVRRANLLPVEEGFIQYVPSSREFVVQDFNRAFPSGSYYWSLPRQYLGNRVSGCFMLHRVGSMVGVFVLWCKTVTAPRSW